MCVLPAGVVGRGGPGPGGQRRARHQDHPVEQHPWTGGHDEVRGRGFPLSHNISTYGPTWNLTQFGGHSLSSLLEL